ncbi:methyltransferase domain-containing protein [Alienimonas sp. DA493]|uniref:methyltransferase domain-containing protein n=1 Tax=Alienimonas sp. DA493 TaxID=3373605 RepID=UPI0037551F0A
MIRTALRRVVGRSPAQTARWVRFHLYELYRERRLGVRTAAFAPGGDAISDENERYEPTCYRCVEEALDDLEIDPGRDVFVDYGCGKGRAVAVAATRPFRKAIGVELSEPLAADARENLRRSAGTHRCGGWEIVVADAAAYAVPADVTVIFLFNSFHGSVLRAALEQVRRSWESRPRPLAILYKIPAGQADLLAEIDWLTRRRETALPNCRWEGMRLLIYEPADLGEPDRSAEAGVPDEDRG